MMGHRTMECLCRAFRRPVLCLIGAAALSACGTETAPEETAAVPSEALLERSITDEMLPYDTLRSHPPLAGPAPAAKTDSTAQGDSAAAETSAATDSEPVAAAEEAPAEPVPPAEGD